MTGGGIAGGLNRAIRPTNRAGGRAQANPSRSRRKIAAELEAASAACAREGVRLTDLRRSVLALILEADGPLTAYQLLDRLKETRRSAVPPTIYRALDFLLARRLIHKVQSLNAFIPCIEPLHAKHQAQFLICRSCGAVTELDDRAVTCALDNAAARRGFRAVSAVVEISGECESCAHAPVG